MTATSAAGKATALAATAAITSEPRAPEETSSPTVEGPLTAGQTLTADPGAWSGGESISYRYQWQRCNEEGEECKAIAGATAAAYVLEEADVGSSLRVTVTATNLIGSAEATSGASEAVGAPGPPQAGEQGPSIHGDTQVGQKAYADNGGWTGSRPLKYHYQWIRCNAAGEECAAVGAATSSSYTITSADENATLRIAVTATNALGSAIALSPAAAVAPEGQMSTTPAIEAAEASDPSILAPAESAYLEEQTVAPRIANAEEQVAASGGLTSSTASKETTGELAVNTALGEISLAPVNPDLNATADPTIVNGAVAAYAGTYPETDTFVRPTPLGATTVLQLRSTSAPRSFSWEVGIGANQQLEQLPDGDVALVEPADGASLEGELPVGVLEEAASEAAETPSGEGTREGEAEEALERGFEEEGLLEKLPAAPETTTPPITPRAAELHPQETTAEYDRGSSAMQTAEAETADTAIMVIQAPQVLDAGGNPVPATLSVQGDTVTLTIAPGESAVYPLAAEMAVSAPTDAASAVKPHKPSYGLSDEHVSAFAESEEKGEKVAHFDQRLKTGPLKVRFARKIVTWNALHVGAEKQSSCNGSKRSSAPG